MSHHSFPLARTFSQPRIGQRRYGKRTQGWSVVTVLWALYYFAIFTLARSPDHQRKIIWSGAVLLGSATLFRVSSEKTPLPTEALLISGLALWSLGALWEVTDFTSFASYLKLVVEMAFVVWGTAVSLSHTGGMRWFFLAFVAAGVFNVVVGLDSLKMESLVGVEGQRRASGLNTNPNSLGFYCFMGILGALALLGDTRSWAMRGGLILASVICSYGILASASRGAFLATILAVFLWPVFCLRTRLRRRWTVLLIILALGLPVTLGIYWTMQNTLMGARVEQALHQTDGSSQSRLQLGLIGLRLCVERPIFGWGLGQFPLASGTGWYAHNEWSELLATTGIIGFGLYMAAYATAWQRLTLALRGVSDPSVQYKINVGRLIVILLVLSGALFRPNFICVDSMFLIGIAVGTGQWAKSHSCRLIIRGKRPQSFNRKQLINMARLSESRPSRHPTSL